MNVESMVQQLNEEIYGLFTPNGEYTGILDSIPPLVEYRSDGFTHGVEFAGINLWDSDEDDRPYSLEDPEEKIPLMEHLRKEINKFADVFGRIYLTPEWRAH